MVVNNKFWFPKSNLISKDEFRDGRNNDASKQIYEGILNCQKREGREVLDIK